MADLARRGSLAFTLDADGRVRLRREDSTGEVDSDIDFQPDELRWLAMIGAPEALRHAPQPKEEHHEEGRTDDRSSSSSSSPGGAGQAEGEDARAGVQERLL